MPGPRGFKAQAVPTPPPRAPATVTHGPADACPEPRCQNNREPSLLWKGIAECCWSWADCFQTGCTLTSHRPSGNCLHLSGPQCSHLFSGDDTTHTPALLFFFFFSSLLCYVLCFEQARHRASCHSPW